MNIVCHRRHWWRINHAPHLRPSRWEESRFVNHDNNQKGEQTYLCQSPCRLSIQTHSQTRLGKCPGTTRACEALRFLGPCVCCRMNCLLRYVYGSEFSARNWAQTCRAKRAVVVGWDTEQLSSAERTASDKKYQTSRVFCARPVRGANE